MAQDSGGKDSLRPAMPASAHNSCGMRCAGDGALRNVIWNGTLYTSSLQEGDLHVVPQGAHCCAGCRSPWAVGGRSSTRHMTWRCVQPVTRSAPWLPACWLRLPCFARPLGRSCAALPPGGCATSAAQQPHVVAPACRQASSTRSSTPPAATWRCWSSTAPPAPSKSWPSPPCWPCRPAPVSDSVWGRAPC